VGDNLVDRLLGKELCVLAWDIEGMDMDNIAIAVRNWLALRGNEFCHLIFISKLFITKQVEHRHAVALQCIRYDFILERSQTTYFSPIHCAG
jgi:hypothetical protein